MLLESAIPPLLDQPEHRGHFIIQPLGHTRPPSTQTHTNPLSKREVSSSCEASRILPSLHHLASSSKHTHLRARISPSHREERACPRTFWIHLDTPSRFSLSLLAHHPLYLSDLGCRARFILSFLASMYVCLSMGVCVRTPQGKKVMTLSSPLPRATKGKDTTSISPSHLSTLGQNNQTLTTLWHWPLLSPPIGSWHEGICAPVRERKNHGKRQQRKEGERESLVTTLPFFLSPLHSLIGERQRREGGSPYLVS